MKKYMVDSNILIEYFKDTPEAVKIIETIREKNTNEYYITIDTLEEILYILVRHLSGKSYWELKNNPEIAKKYYKTIIPLIETIIKSSFEILPTTQKTYETFMKVCKKYGLLPKDALLLTLCIDNKINNIITFDTDFKNLDLKKIKIISSAEDIK